MPAHPPRGGKKRSVRVKQQKRTRQKAVERGCRPCCHRPPGSRWRQCRGLRQRRGGRCTACDRHSVYRPQSRGQLSRLSRQHRQLSRQRAATNAALPARGERRRDRTRLRQGHRQSDGGSCALECRPDARDDGDLQRLVRPHADGDPWRDGPRRYGPPQALDRLDPYRARPGCAGTRLYQVGRQPASPIAAREAVLRANWIANAAPRGPTYVNLDAGMQESKLAEPVPPIDSKRFMPPVAGAAPAAAIKQAADLLRNAKQPVILAGRTSRDIEAWNKRVALAERLNARVVTDLKIAASFPTSHYLHAGAPGGTVLAQEAADAIRAADVILSLDWL